MQRVCLIARRAYDMIERECRAYPDVETGGALLGALRPEGFCVLFSAPAGPRAHRSRVEFRPSVSWQQGFVDFCFWRFRARYIGDWHKHPTHVPTPSATDLATARRIVASKRWNTAEALFPIATLENGRVNVRVFVISREAPDFKEIPLEVLPDADPRLACILMDPDEGEVIRHATPRSGRRCGSTRAFFRRLSAGLWHRAHN